MALLGVFTELLAGVMGPLAPGISVPAEFLELRNMLASWAERWKRQWLVEGEQTGRPEGKAALVRRLLEVRFGKHTLSDVPDHK